MRRRPRGASGKSALVRIHIHGSPTRAPSLGRFTLVARIVRAVLVVSALSVTGCSNGGSQPSSWDWVGVVGTGQSLSVAIIPITSTKQPFQNLKLSLGSVRQDHD